MEHEQRTAVPAQHPPGPVEARTRPLPPPSLAPGAGPPLAAALAAAGYRAGPLAELLGTDPHRLLRVSELPAYPLRVPAAGLGALVRLLLLGLPVDAAALPDGLAGRLAAGGLAVVEGPRLLPAAQLVPHGALLVASDLPALQDPDVVVGVQAPTATLADLTPRRRVDRALDLGTGCGLQALLLAGHAREVVATDVNPRALAYAAVNAALAGVHVQLRQGPWFAPVEGEAFDLVVANPPYVLSPGARWTYRDAGLPRDGASRLVAQGLPDVLREDGTAVALLAWVDPGPEQAPPPLAWSAGRGCDALLLATGAADAWSTATAWNADERDPGAYAARVERWLAWMRAEAIEAVEYGALVLRRTGGSTTRRVALPGPPDGPSGEQVLRLLAPAAPPDARSVLRPAPDVVLQQRLRAGPDGWVESDAVLAQASGLRLSLALPPAAVGPLARLDGARPLHEAAGLRTSPTGVSDDDLPDGLLPVLAAAVAAGLLLPGALSVP